MKRILRAVEQFGGNDHIGSAMQCGGLSRQAAGLDIWWHAGELDGAALACWFHAVGIELEGRLQKSPDEGGGLSPVLHQLTPMSLHQRDGGQMCPSIAFDRQRFGQSWPRRPGPGREHDPSVIDDRSDVVRPT